MSNKKIGMLDQSEKEIAEGDIVHGIERWQLWNHIGVVKYEPKKAAYVLTLPGDEVDPDKSVLLWDYDSVQILGNVKDNPEIELSMLFYGDEGYNAN